MKELYAIESRTLCPGQISAYLEYTETEDLHLFRMWINPEIAYEELHPRFKFLSKHGRTEFNNQETIKFIQHRVYEPGYEGIKEILKNNGLAYYDAWELFKAYRGRHTSDDLEIELVSRTP